jgi:hypothetical protein
MTVQQLIKVLAEILGWNVCQEPESTHIDTNDRQIDLSQRVCNVKHGAIPPNDDSQINAFLNGSPGVANPKSIDLLMGRITQKYDITPRFEVRANLCQGGLNGRVLISPEESYCVESHKIFWLLVRQTRHAGGLFIFIANLLCSGIIEKE